MTQRVVRCSVLGQTEIEADGIRLTPESERQFGVALYFCANAGRPVARDDVAQLFWPEHSDEAARHCLRQTLYRLRAFGMPVRSGPRGTALDARLVEADYAPVVAEGTPASAYLGLSSVIVLPGYAPRFSEPFTDWLDGFRADLSARLRRGLVRAIAEARSRGRYAEVEQLARQCLSLDPLNEEATLALAEAVALAGSKVEAVGMIERYLEEVGGRRDLRIPAEILRSRVSELVPLPEYLESGSSALLGRDSALEWLSTLLSRSTHKTPSFAYLVGEPGVGKTALVDEFLRTVALRNVAAVRVVCHPADIHKPLAVLTELAGRLLRLPGALGASPASLAVLGAVTRVQGIRGESGAAQTTQLRSHQIEEAFADLVDAISHESPLLLFIDDIHWLDEKSVRVLLSLFTPSRPLALMVIACSRLRGTSISSRDLTEFANFVLPYRLAPLSLDQSKQLLRNHLGTLRTDLDDARLQSLADLCGGNPLFLSQLATHLRRHRDGDPIPISLRALLAEKLQLLSPNALLVIRAAALMGRAASLRRIERLLGQPTYILLNALAELEKAGLATGDGSDIRCRHEIIAETTRDHIPPSVAILLHRRAARLLEKDAACTGDPSLLWQSADHSSSADQPTDTRRILVKLGKYLMRIGAAKGAAQAFERALASSPSIREQYKLTGSLLIALRAERQWQDILRVHDQRRALERQLGKPQPTHADLSLLEVEARFHLSADFANELPLVMERLSSTESQGERTALVLIGLIMADNLVDKAGATALYAHLNPDYRKSSDADSENTLAAALIYHTTFGRLDEAVQCAQRIIARQESASAAIDVRSLQRLRWTAVPLLYADCVAEAEGSLRAALTAAQEKHVWSEACAASRALAELSLHQSNLMAAGEWIAEARRQAERAADDLYLADLDEVAAKLALLQGETLLARTHMERATKFALRRPERRTRVRYLGLKVAVDLADGGVDMHEVNELRALAGHTMPYGDHDLAVSALAKALELHGDQLGAYELLGAYVTSRRERAPMPTALVRHFWPDTLPTCFGTESRELRRSQLEAAPTPPAGVARPG